MENASSTDMWKLWLDLIVCVALAMTQAQTAVAAEDSSTDEVVSFESHDGTFWKATLKNSAFTDLARLTILKGRVSNHALSPGGNAVAYTRHDGSRRRSVEIADLTTGHITRLSAIPTHTSYGPEWSNDGRRLAINTFDWKRWNVALIGADNTNYQALDSSKAEGCMEPSWAPSGQWLCCLSGAVWKIGTDGKTTRVLAARETIPNAILTVPRSCSVSADEDTILFEEELRDDEIPWHSGGRRVLFAVKASGEGAHRVGPDQFWASAPHFVDKRRFLFLGFSLREHRSLLAIGGFPVMNLYLGSLDSGDAVLLRTRVREFSIARRRGLPSNPALNPTGLRPAG
ncbi:MAG: translocation protein TolB [Myxococcales bacterium]|nr:translocation protein TolB [Myxococcales bacterium]